MVVLILYFLVDAIVSELYGPLAGTISAAVVGTLASVIQYIIAKKKGKSVSFKALLVDFFLVVIFVLFDVVKYTVEGGERLMPVVLALFSALFSFAAGWGKKFNPLNTLIQNLGHKAQSPYALYLMRNTMRRMTAWCSLVAIVYLLDYFGLIDEISSFIDDWFLVIVVPLAFVTEFIISRIMRSKYESVEWVPLVDAEGKIIGESPRPLVHNGSGWLHPVVHLHVFNDKGRILLQKRPAHKKIQPLKWDTAVGGHISVGEKVEVALQREAREEIGLHEFTAQHAHSYIWHSSVENEYVIAFKTINNGPFEPEIKEEVDELRFWSREEIQAEFNKPSTECNLTPNLCEELRKLGFLTE